MRTQLEWTLKEIGIITRNWIDSAQDMDYWRTLANAALNLRAPEVMELFKLLLLFMEAVVATSLYYEG